MKACPALGEAGLTVLPTVTSASAVTVNVSVPVLLAMLGSKVTLETARALLVRVPALPPGRTETSTTGQLVPAVQGGSVAMVQDNRPPVPVAPPDGVRLQTNGDATP